MEIADTEGEDYNLKDMIPESLKDYLKKSIKELIDYPPRIILSKLYQDSKWRNAVIEAAKIYITKTYSINKHLKHNK